MQAIQGRAIATAVVVWALATAGGSSASDCWVTAHEELMPVLARGSAGGDEISLHRDALSNRRYALDALALKYVGDYTDDPEVEDEIRRGYWCGTPVIEQMGRIPASERSETALRERARAMVERTVRTGQDGRADLEQAR